MLNKVALLPELPKELFLPRFMVDFRNIVKEVLVQFEP
jgi:hypothetical protein